MTENLAPESRIESVKVSQVWTELNVHDRCTLEFGTGNTTLTVKCEGSVDGKSWAPTFEGKATKK